MELLHKRQFDYYCKITNKVDLVNYIKTVMANNFIEEIHYLFLRHPDEFKHALNQIEYLYSKQLNAFVYPPRDYIKYKQGAEQLREVAQ